MFDQYKTFLDIFLLSLGAVLGSYLRFQIISQFSLRGLSQHWPILFINTFSCFSLGLITALEDTIKTYDINDSLRVFFVIGFLASFSTFSSFLWEFCLNLQGKKWFKSFFILSSSLLGGALFVLAGYRLGNN